MTPTHSSKADFANLRSTDEIIGADRFVGMVDATTFDDDDDVVAVFGSEPVVAVSVGGKIAAG